MRDAVTLGTLLLLTLACKSPHLKPQPTAAEIWAAQVQEASVKPMATLLEKEKAEYAQGFENGAAMVRKALDTGRSPYVLLPGKNKPAPAPKLLGHVPEGVTLAPEEAPQIEMDAATGLKIWDWGSTEGSAYSRGQKEGFAWALSRHGASLVKPRQLPSFPDRWLCWPTNATSVRLESLTREVEVYWRAEAILWKTTGQGFPAQRRWRPAYETWRPRFVALQEDVLWLDTVGHGAVALDLETGLILDLKSSPNPKGLEAAVTKRVVAEEAEIMETEKELTPEALSQHKKELGKKPDAVAHRKDLRIQAERGDAKAMFSLAVELAGLGGAEEQEGAEWLEKSARLGCIEAMSTLGAWHYEGRCVAKSESLARAWLGKAAKAGDPDAKHLLTSLP